MPKNVVSAVIGVLVLLRHSQRDERGLTQSTENAILLAGAVAVAGVIITIIGAYVKTHLPK